MDQSLAALLGCDAEIPDVAVVRGRCRQGQAGESAVGQLRKPSAGSTRPGSRGRTSCPLRPATWRFLCGARHGWPGEGCRPFQGLLVGALAERQPTAGLGPSRRRGPLVAQALNVPAHSCTQAHRDARPAPRSHARSQGRLAGDGDRIGDGGADLEEIGAIERCGALWGPRCRHGPPGAWARACPYVLGRPDSFHAELVIVKLFAGPLSGQGGEGTVRPRHGPGPSDPAMSKSADPRGDPEETL